MVERGSYGDNSTMTRSDAITAQEASRRAHLEMGHALSARAHGIDRRSPLDVLPDDQIASLAKTCGASGDTSLSVGRAWTDAQSVRFEKGNVARPILNDLHDRLTLAHDRLLGVASRVEGFADRVLGSLPAEPKGVNGGTGSSCAVQSLLTVLEDIERVAGRLDEVAHRVERIG